MNLIVIKGRLVREPDFRTNDNETNICRICVAVDRNAGKNTDFFNVVSFGKTAIFLEKYFKKGQEILVSGEMTSNKFVDKEGNNKISWEIITNRVDFCGNKSSQNTTSTQTAEYDTLTPPPEEQDLPF